MILDERLEFCDATSVALTAGAAWQNIGDVIPLSVARDLGNGQPIYLVITTATEIITAGSAGTIAFRLVSDDSGTLHVSTSSVHVVSPTYVTDDAAANSAQLNAGGVILAVALPMADYETFLGIQVNVLTTDTVNTNGASTINAFLTCDVSKWAAYADNTAIA
jgi:hypothetical protein